MNIIAKSLLHAAVIVTRVFISLPLILIALLLDVISKVADQASDLCHAGCRNINRLVPTPWMVTLSDAVSKDSERRRENLLRDLRG